jgi:hypothetical protein
MKTKRWHPLQALAVAACIGLAPSSAHAQTLATTEQIDENIAYAIGVQAVFYGFGPVVMHQGILAQTDADSPSDNGQAPINQMGHARNLYGPDDKLVVTANNDTLYSIAALDLSREPMVPTIPDTNGRYYIMQLLDAYSRSIEDIGIGTLGAKGGTFAIVGPHWTGELPPEMVMIRSPTPEVSIIGRTGVDSPEDLAKAHEVQDAYRLVPLSEYASPVKKTDLAHKGASAQVLLPKGFGFYAVLDAPMRKNPLPEDAPVTDQFKRIGIGLNKPFDAASLPAPTQRGLGRALADSLQAIQRTAKDTGSRVNGWYMNGKNRYTLSFDGKVPVRAFWSLTMHDAKELCMVQNAIKRYSIGERASRPTPMAA